MPTPRQVLVGVLAAALLAGPALAHESGGRNRGTIERISPEELAVKTTDGHVVVYRITPRTRFDRAGTATAPGDAKIGERVVVEGTAQGAELTASRVKLPAMGQAGGPGAERR